MNLMEAKIQYLFNKKKISEFIQELIEDVFAYSKPNPEEVTADNPQKPTHRSDWIALKKLYLTLANLNKILRPIE